MKNIGRMLVTAAGLVLSFAFLWAAQTAVNSWTEDAVWFSVSGGTNAMFTYVLGCSLGMLLAMAPWLNNAQTPRIARVLVGVMGFVTLATGMVLVTQVIPFGIHELAEFEVADGWIMLAYTVLATVTGILAVLGAIFKVTPEATQQ
jgi:hypothetical protein